MANPFTALPTTNPSDDLSKREYSGVPSLSEAQPLSSSDPVGDAIFAGISDDATVASIPPPGGFGGPFGGSDAVSSIPPPGFTAGPQASAFQTGVPSGQALQPPQAHNAWASDPQHSFPRQASDAVPGCDAEGNSVEPSDIDQEAPFYKLDFWRKYFDVDTVDVVSRAMKGSMPFSKAFNETIGNNPDMYGPIWICNTLIFACALCGNMASYFASNSDDVWQYDFEKLTFGAAIVYGYVGLVPLLLALVLYAMGEGEGLPISYLLCLYGYIMLVFIPAAVLCTIPSELLRWVAVGAAFAISGGTLFGNLGPIILSSVPARGTIICVVLAALHVGIALAFKLYFFEF